MPLRMTCWIVLTLHRPRFRLQPLVSPAAPRLLPSQSRNRGSARLNRRSHLRSRRNPCPNQGSHCRSRERLPPKRSHLSALAAKPLIAKFGDRSEDLAVARGRGLLSLQDPCPASESSHESSAGSRLRWSATCSVPDCLRLENRALVLSRGCTCSPTPQSLRGSRPGPQGRAPRPRPHSG